MQIGRECRKFTKALDVHVVCVYGGTGISEQIAELKRGAEVIVCTPGRMIDMLAANSGMINLFVGHELKVCYDTQYSSVQFDLFNSFQRKSQWKASLKRWVLSPARNWLRLMDMEWRHNAIEEFNMNWEAECDQLNLALVAKQKNI